MRRPQAGSYLLTMILLISMALPTARLASAGPVERVESPRSAATASTLVRADGESLVEAPGHHFGFGLARTLAQATPNVPVGLAGLQQLNNISVPGWSLANPPSFDIQAFDWTRSIVYVAARNPVSNVIGNSGPGLLAIDTTTNTIIGTLPVPDCNAVNVQRNSFQCPSGVSVLNDQRKIVVT